MNGLILGIIIAVGFLFIVTTTITTILLIKIKNRNTVRGIVFLKSGGQIRLDWKRKNTAPQSLNGMEYVFDEKAVIKTTMRDYIYHIEGNPKPIIINFKNMQPEIVGTELKEILDTDLVQKLLNDQDAQILKLLIIINLVLGVISVILLFILLLGKGVHIKPDKTNYDFLYNVTRNAMLGV